MIYKKIKVDILDIKADLLTGLLLDHNITSFEVIDNLPVDNPYDFDYEELKPDLPKANGMVSIIFYLEENKDEKPIIDVIASVIPDASFAISFSDENDWRDKWKEYFHAFSIGDILIRPSWEKYEGNDNKIEIEIDPGVSFGTGAHETTRMCIEALKDCDLSNKKVLDAGCGSGILSIAANKLGARDITCIDIDPDCITTTKENALKNKCDTDDFTYYTGDIMSNEALYNSLFDESFDVVCANILADIIVTMLPRLSPKIKKGGKIITSGIIEGKEKIVSSALVDNGFRITNTKKDGEWYMIAGIRE